MVSFLQRHSERRSAKQSFRLSNGWSGGCVLRLSSQSSSICGARRRNLLRGGTGAAMPPRRDHHA